MVHSEYLQLLTGFAIGFGIDTLLVTPPTPCHIPTKATPPEWSWLEDYADTIRLSECFTKRLPLPKNLKPNLHEVEISPTEKYQPTVSGRENILLQYIDVFIIRIVQYGQSVWTLI